MRIKAPAKINLCLAITGRRNGYHLLDSVMQETDLCDTLEIERADAVQLTVMTGGAVPADNTAVRAARLFFSASGIPGGAAIRLWKRIPAEAGLGGGSSDGAAVLKALNALCGGVLGEAQLAELALQVGADCPFFLRGGTQRAQGVGEELTPLRLAAAMPLLLVKPAAGVSTAAAFALADQLPPHAVDTGSCVRALEAGDLDAYFALAGNALQPAALRLVPEIAELGTRCCRLGARFWLMSGSGSCLFACFESEAAQKRALAELQQDRRIFAQAAAMVSAN